MPLIMIAGKPKDLDFYNINSIFCHLSTTGMETLTLFPLPITLFDRQKRNVTTSVVEVQMEVKCLAQGHNGNAQLKCTC